MIPSYPSSLILLQLVICIFLLPILCQGWVSQTPCSLHPTHSTSITTRPLDSKLVSESSRGRLRIILASSTSSTESLSVTSNEDDDDDDDEYEYVEYDILTEAEFMGSEWLVGTVMDNKGGNIGETWVRMATDKDGKNVAIWGDNSEGTWNFDVANQFLSVSKNALWGKNIWAGVVDDFYFCRGTVRGWNYFSPASVVGQWQAKRLGVEAGEAGVAPWFEESEEDVEETPALTEADSTTENDL